MNAFDLFRPHPPTTDPTNVPNTPIANSPLPSALPWVEKYRPKSIRHVQGQESTTRVLANALHRADLPHMLFYGPPGTGKTSTVLALARELFGPELMKSRVLELNASDERGISVVRDKIKNFAKVAVGPASWDYPCPAYKIIILDEADSMTQDAQSALRRIMETYSKITRFCLICNYVTRIIEPIVSRCSKFRFKPMSQSDTFNKLSEISKLESVKILPRELNALIKISSGDLRRSITLLQSASKLSLSANEQVSGMINAEDVDEIGGVVPKHAMRRLLESVGIDDLVLREDGDDVEMENVDLPPQKSRPQRTSFEKIKESVEEILLQGYSAVQLLNQLHDVILLNPLIDSKPKTLISIALGETDKALSDGAEEFLQVLNLCLKISKSFTQ